MSRHPHPVPVHYDEDISFDDNRPVLRQLNSLEMAVHTVSKLAVVFAFGLALILIAARQG